MSQASPTRDNSSVIRRWAFVAVAVVSVLYAPLAFTYMWFLVNPHAPQLQDSLTTVINGHEYAVGKWSVVGQRYDDYHQNRTAMVTHTMLGSIALMLAISQFVTPLRTRFPKVHRYVGRSYLLIMTGSMIGAVIYLARTTPVQYIGGIGFQVQLWFLALGTLGSGWWAVYLIRRREVVGHRAWMAMNFSFMLTAPLLRVGWVLLAPVLPAADLLMNLGLTSIFEAVAAPGAGVVAFMLTRRIRHGAPLAERFPTILVLAAAAGVVGMIAVVVEYLAITDGLLPLSGLVAIAGVGAGYFAICMAGAVRAARAGDAERAHFWQVFTLGAGASPVFVAGLAVLLAPVDGIANGLVVGGMIGPPLPIVLGFMYVVDKAGRQRQNELQARRQLVNA